VNYSREVNDKGAKNLIRGDLTGKTGSGSEGLLWRKRERETVSTWFAGNKKDFIAIDLYQKRMGADGAALAG